MSRGDLGGNYSGANFGSDDFGGDFGNGGGLGVDLGSGSGNDITNFDGKGGGGEFFLRSAGDDAEFLF